jgi:hypothetical protein
MSQKISQMTSGNPAQQNDIIPIVRSGANYAVTAGSIAALAALAGIQSATVTLSASQINNLTTSPVTLVPAQGSNKVIAAMFLFVSYTYNGTAFDQVFDNAEVTYAGSGHFAVGLQLTGSFSQGLSQSSSQFGQYLAFVNGLGNLSDVVNQDLVVSNTGAAITGGAGSTVTFTLYYTVVAV